MPPRRRPHCPTRAALALLGLGLLGPGAAGGQLRSIDPVSGRPVVVRPADARAPERLAIDADPFCLRAGGSPRFGRVDFVWRPTIAVDRALANSIDDRPAGTFPSLDGFPLDAFRLRGFRAPSRNELAEAHASLPLPLRVPNRDLRDGVPTSRAPYHDPDSPDDLLSLDSLLTAEQRALLGCGPFYGTRCDASAPDPELGLAAGLGVDLRRAELGALVQALPATLGGRLAYQTTRLRADPSDGFGIASDTACLRPAPGDPLADDVGRVRLPGCRGIAGILTPDLESLPAGAPIEFLFERGYTPAVDGCVLGASNPHDPASRGVAIAGHPVLARRLRPRDDPAFDASDPVGSAEEITALLDATCGGLGEPSEASATRIGTPRYAGASPFRSVAQTAWHPLAGCGSVAAAPAPRDPDSLLRLEVRRRKGFPGFDTFTDLGDVDAILRGGCDFTSRDFEREFLEGRAELFRSEMAVVSWNFLIFLATASCAGAGSGDPGEPECFDPQRAWEPDRCSLAAPQFCRNVRPLLEATLDDDRDGIPDSLQTVASCGPVRATPGVLWPPRKGFVAVEIEPGEELAGAGLRVTGVTQDEPTRRRGRRGRPSARADGDRVWLEADRFGSGNGRVYRLTYTAERPIPGICGATTRCTGSVEVCVPRTRRSGCHDDGQYYDATAPRPR